MTPTNLSKTIKCASILPLIFLLTSCASTSLQQTWKQPGATRPEGKTAVIAIEERGLIRQGFENRLVYQLAKAGAPALTTFDEFTLPNIKADKQAAAQRFLAKGAGSVLILRLANSASSFREVQPGGERYTSTITGIESWGWYDYYSVGLMNMSPTYGSMKQTVYLEATLFDLKSERRLWSGITKTVIKENTDKVAEMDPLVGRIVAGLQKDKLVP